MANVTDAAFRRMIAKYGKPDVMYTEFVSADGLLRADAEGKAKLLRDLTFTEAERPIVAQFFTSDLTAMENAARIAAELGFDGIDINMGCPDRSIEKQGAGAKLMLNPERAQELIAAAKRGAPNLPVSVKTRIGYNKDILEEWLPALLAAEPAAIVIHARTRKEMSKVPAHWERIARAVEIRNEMKSKTLIVGNGDCSGSEDARVKAEETGADGVMLGRAFFGSPWLFKKEEGAGRSGFSPLQVITGTLQKATSPRRPSPAVQLRIAVEHAKLFEESLGDIKSFSVMKKHFKAYVEGFKGAKELRAQLMETENVAEVEKIIENFLQMTAEK